MNIMSSNFMGFAAGRDEVTDPARGDEERESRESRDEEKDELYEGHYAATAQHEDVSVFSTLTKLLFNPFLDGYCKVWFILNVY